jgi:yeast amino acid transporter
VGVEIVAMTAFEAKSRDEIRRPVKYIAHFVSLVYFLSFIGFVINVKWCDPSLPTLYDQRKSANHCEGILSSRNTGHRNSSTMPPLKSSAIVIIALIEAGERKLPGILNGCLIFSVISGANTALYVASRTLFGLTREIDPSHGPIHRFLAKLGTSHPTTQVPAHALLASTLAFCWLPFVHLSIGHSIEEVRLPNCSS